MKLTKAWKMLNWSITNSSEAIMHLSAEILTTISQLWKNPSLLATQEWEWAWWRTPDRLIIRTKLPLQCTSTIDLARTISTISNLVHYWIANYLFSSRKTYSSRRYHISKSLLLIKKMVDCKGQLKQLMEEICLTAECCLVPFKIIISKAKREETCLYSRKLISKMTWIWMSYKHIWDLE